ncbi:MAG: hypothetical protein EOO72_00135 [Myxococcaceae bacterium]|nr:MAG: hypothetical protein EOO72_00135 [Myxococcaceae bacterium]
MTALDHLDVSRIHQRFQQRAALTGPLRRGLDAATRRLTEDEPVRGRVVSCVGHRPGSEERHVADDLRQRAPGQSGHFGPAVGEEVGLKLHEGQSHR